MDDYGIHLDDLVGGGVHYSGNVPREKRQNGYVTCRVQAYGQAFDRVSLRTTFQSPPLRVVPTSPPRRVLRTCAATGRLVALVSLSRWTAAGASVDGG